MRKNRHEKDNERIAARRMNGREKVQVKRELEYDTQRCIGGEECLLEESTIAFPINYTPLKYNYERQIGKSRRAMNLLRI